jgi:hypothetical protein
MRREKTKEEMEAARPRTRPAVKSLLAALLGFDTPLARKAEMADRWQDANYRARVRARRRRNRMAATSRRRNRRTA